MIGISGIVGSNIHKNYIQKFQKIHTVTGVTNKYYNFQNNFCAITLTMRLELANDGLGGNFYQDEGYVIFFEGYICKSKFYLTRTFQNDAHYILYNWINFGEIFIKNLNGEYVISIYKKDDDTLIIINDRFASRPFYYLNKDNNLIFASEKKAIFAVYNGQLSFSEIGLLEFILFSHNLSNRTIYNDVFAIPPASILVYKNKNCKIKQYWNFTYTGKKITNISEFLVKLGITLKKAAEKRYIGRNYLGLGLSGGLDSRVIAVTIPDTKQGVYARTYGALNSLEVQIAKEIAKRKKFDHYIHEPKNIVFSKFLYPAVWRTDGSVPFTGLKSIVEHNILKDKMLYNLGGQFGDVLTGKTILPYMLDPFLKKDQFIELVFDKYTRRVSGGINLIKRIFNKQYFKENFPLLKEMFIKSFSNIEANNNCDLYNVWDILNRQARFTFNSFAVDNYLFMKINLFTDYDYVELLQQTKVRHRFGQILYKQMIASQFSEISDIKNGNLNKTLKPSYVGNFIDLFSHFKIGKQSVKDTKNSNTLDKAGLIRVDRQLRNIIINFIEGDTFPSNIFYFKGIKSVLNDHYECKHNYSNLIGILSTFIAAYDLFYINNYQSQPSIADPFNIK